MLRLCSRCHIICLYSGPLTYWKINFCCWSKAVCLHSIDWLPVAAAVLGGDGSAEVAEETKTGLWRVAIRQSASTGPGIVHSGGLTQPSRSCPQAGGRHACKRECTRKMQREERRGIKKLNVLIKTRSSRIPAVGFTLLLLSICLWDSAPDLNARRHNCGSWLTKCPVYRKGWSPGTIKASEAQKLLRLIVITTRARLNKTRDDRADIGLSAAQHMQGLSGEAAIGLFG